MIGSKSVLTQLNIVLGNELVSINQTFLHSRMFNDWGLDTIGKVEYKKSIKDMKQADQIIARILFLEGLPNLQKLGSLRIGENTEEILECEHALQTDTIASLRAAITECEKASDYISRQLLEDILDDEEEFFDWVETSQDLISKMGLKNFIQSQI